MESFSYLIISLQIVFQTIGVMVLLSAGIVALTQYIVNKPWSMSKSSLHPIENARIALGQKIVFALEFFIIADAIATVLEPTLAELYQIMLIVAVRTALSFFISREMYIMHSYHAREEANESKHKS